MNIADKIVVVTGAASGLGRAMVERFSAEGARAIVATDINEAGLQDVAAATGAKAIPANVGIYADIERVIETTEAEIGAIDLFCSNAGIAVMGGVETPLDEWQRCWDINLMAHVFAARVLVPRMTERGGGYFLHTASAAGLLSQIGSATYAVTKHAAVGFAEWLALTYGDQGIKVSVLCPQAVRTAMTAGTENGGVAGVDGMIEPEQAIDKVVECINQERFLVLPHEEVETYMQRKTANYDRWLKGMARLQAKFGGPPPFS